MATGDVLNPKRPRFEDNERVDAQDAMALSQAPRDHLDAWARAATATPLAAGGAAPVGLILTGFDLTPNPISGSDAKVRIGSSLGVAFDANGRLLIKEAGSTTDITLPSGTSQIYAYHTEDQTDLAVRRKIAVASPYAESPASIYTTLDSDVLFYVRAGDATSVVSSDNVNGKTTPLLLLGVATNTAGAVTITGYSSTTAPNGSFVTNRLTTAQPPTTPPTFNTRSGSIKTLVDLVQAIVYLLGMDQWGGAGSQDATSGQLVAYSGSSTSVSGTPATLNDTAQNFPVNGLVGCWLKDNAGAFWPITSNTATAIVSTGNGPAWWYNATTGSRVIPNGPPTAGNYTVYGPVAKNNYGAYNLGVGISAQSVFDWLAQYATQPHTWAKLQTFTVAPTAPDYKFTSGQTIIIPAAMAEVGSGVTNPPVTFPFALPAGMTVGGYGFHVDKATASGTHLYGVLLKSQDDASATTANADTGNAVGPGTAWGIDNNGNSTGAVTMSPALAAVVPVSDTSHQMYLCISGSDSSTPAKTYDSYGNHKRWSLNSGVDFVMFAYVTLTRQ